MKPARLTWIDYARGIAIILVLYRHVFEGIKESGTPIANYMYLEYANIFFFSFRMPLFFIVSGLFVASSLKKRGVKEFIETKARIILYPYFLWACLQITIQMIFSKYTNAKPDYHTYLYLFYIPKNVDQFWYLYALFNVAVLYVLAKAKLGITPIWNIVIGLVLYYIAAIAFQTNVIIGFIGDIFHYYLFFAIGDAISRYITDRNNFKYFESWKLLLLMLLPFIAAQVYFLKVNIDYASNKYQYVEYFQPFIYLPIALVGCAFIMNLTFVLQKLNLKILSWVPELGRHSMYIYVAQVMVFAAVRIFMKKVLGINDVPLLLIAGIISGLIVPVWLFKLSVRFNMRWLFTLEKHTVPALNEGSIKPLAVNILEKNN